MGNPLTVDEFMTMFSRGLRAADVAPPAELLREVSLAGDSGSAAATPSG